MRRADVFNAEDNLNAEKEFLCLCKYGYTDLKYLIIFLMQKHVIKLIKRHDFEKRFINRNV